MLIAATKTFDVDKLKYALGTTFNMNYLDQFKTFLAWKYFEIKRE